MKLRTEVNDKHEATLLIKDDVDAAKEALREEII
jgi:hypothetical protein